MFEWFAIEQSKGTAPKPPQYLLYRRVRWVGVSSMSGRILLGNVICATYRTSGCDRSGMFGGRQNRDSGNNGRIPATITVRSRALSIIGIVWG